jgi:SpoVK/Ycf46/Vps4 family AAA+-type ATPase
MLMLMLMCYAAACMHQTLLANAIAGELGVSFVKISAPEIVSGMSGESEQKVNNNYLNLFTFKT